MEANNQGYIRCSLRDFLKVTDDEFIPKMWIKMRMVHTSNTSTLFETKEFFDNRYDSFKMSMFFCIGSDYYL